MWRNTRAPLLVLRQRAKVSLRVRCAPPVRRVASPRPNGNFMRRRDGLLHAGPTAGLQYASCATVSYMRAPLRVPPPRPGSCGATQRALRKARAARRPASLTRRAACRSVPPATMTPAPLARRRPPGCAAPHWAAPWRGPRPARTPAHEGSKPGGETAGLAPPPRCRPTTADGARAQAGAEPGHHTAVTTRSTPRRCYGAAHAGSRHALPHERAPPWAGQAPAHELTRGRPLRSPTPHGGTHARTRQQGSAPSPGSKGP